MERFRYAGSPHIEAFRSRAAGVPRNDFCTETRNNIIYHFRGIRLVPGMPVSPALFSHAFQHRNLPCSSAPSISKFLDNVSEQFRQKESKSIQYWLAYRILFLSMKYFLRKNQSDNADEYCHPRFLGHHQT